VIIFWKGNMAYRKGDKTRTRTAPMRSLVAATVDRDNNVEKPQ
jgi:hypothetical protein